MMRNALIGHTGFVGSCIARAAAFNDYYNSANYLSMKGQTFDQMTCAGLYAVKWKANQNPEEDLAYITRLEEVLKTVRAKQFVLISTIDVYPILTHKDELFDCHLHENQPYGRHRLSFEDFCMEYFENCTIVRLPALFGEGLKKNIIFDLLHDNQLDRINPNSSFQYYSLDDLWNDMKIVVESDVPIVNFFTEPVLTQTILDRFFPDKQVGSQASPEIHYDLHTRYATLFEKNGPYLYKHGEILERMGRFIQNYVRA